MPSASSAWTASEPRAVMGEEQRGPDTGPLDQAADLFVFAPLGFALEVRRLVPELAARGRRQVVFTRTVGKYAVRRGRQRADELVGLGWGLLSGFLPGGPGPTEDDESEVPVERALAAVPDPIPDAPPSDHLAI